MEIEALIANQTLNLILQYKVYAIHRGLGKYALLVRNESLFKQTINTAHNNLEINFVDEYFGQSFTQYQNNPTNLLVPRILLTED